MISVLLSLIVVVWGMFLLAMAMRMRRGCDD